MVQSLGEYRPAYHFEYFWVNDIFEGGIELTAADEHDRSDRIYHKWK
jgi:hypothetical protein